MDSSDNVSHEFPRRPGGMAARAAFASSSCTCPTGGALGGGSDAMAPGEAASISSTHGVDEGPKHGTCLEAQSGSEMKCPVRANMRAAPQANPNGYAALSTYLRGAEMEVYKLDRKEGGFFRIPTKVSRQANKRSHSNMNG